jgi:hypothetical protein
VIFATTGVFSNTGTINVAGGTSGVANPGPGGPFRHGGTGSDPQGFAGRIITQQQPPPVNVTPITTPVHVYFPVRYTFDPVTGLYSGFLTIVNVGTQDFAGPISIVFTKFPKGVTIANAKVSVGIPPGGIFCSAGEPAGLVFINTTGNLIRGTPLRVFIQFTNPFSVNLSTFYVGPDYGLKFIQGTLI